MVATNDFYVEEMKRKRKPEGPAGFEDVPIGEFEVACLGRYERARMDIPVSEPTLWGRQAEALERLALAFRAAQRAELPAPTDATFVHERLMVILALDRQVNTVGRQFTAMWRKLKRSRSSESNNRKAASVEQVQRKHNR